METPFGTYDTASPQATEALGQALAQHMTAPLTVLLSGDLGAGKTTLSKGLIAGLGVSSPDEVTSPTFSLIHQYDGPPKVYHIDLYRLDRVPELESLGLEDLWEQDAIVLIEWGEKFAEQLPGERWEIRIRDRGESAREFTLAAVGG